MAEETMNGTQQMGMMYPMNGYGMYGMPYGYGYGYGPWAGAYCIDRPVGRETFELQQKVSQLESEKALLASEQSMEVKLATVYEKAAGQSLALERSMNEKQTAQLVWNAQQEARIAVLERDVHELSGMSARYIMADRVSPRPMDKYNSWEAPV